MYRINYRAAQGQAAAGTPGGGMLLDQIQHSFRAIASGASFSEAIAVIPSHDTTDFAVSILGDYDPSSFAPTFRVGRATLTLAASLASAASASAPLVQLKRMRLSSNASVQVSAAIATWDYSAFSTSLPYLPKARAGSLISNGTLQPGDVLVLTNTPVSLTLPVGAGQIMIDILG